MRGKDRKSTGRAGHLITDESGMTMGLAVIMIVLIGVMGAGLLTFVSRDLNGVVEVNQGQRAFEMADAGIEAGERQLESDSNTAHYDSVNSADNIQWAETEGGMDLEMDGNTVNVTVESDAPSTGSFRVISTGQTGEATRKIEAVFTRKSNVDISIPGVYFTQRNLYVSGNTTLNAISLFALGNATAAGNISVGNSPDGIYGRWAETNDDYSYPNPFNSTPRSDYRAGIGAGGELYIDGAPVKAELQPGTRSFGNTYRIDPPTSASVVSGWPKVVPDYDASSLPSNQKIAFPFETAENLSDLEVLRQRAIDLEAETGYNYYKEGLSGEQPINDWPADSTYETVMFYKFNSYDDANKVIWNIMASCSDTTRKGVIVVENGDFEITGNRGGFNGTVVVRGGSADDEGTFSSDGTACITGFVNSRGNMYITGGFKSGTVPSLDSVFNNRGMNLLSWRELYE